LRFRRVCEEDLNKVLNDWQICTKRAHRSEIMSKYGKNEKSVTQAVRRVCCTGAADISLGQLKKETEYIILIQTVHVYLQHTNKLGPH